MFTSPDSIVELTDLSIIQTGDRIRINIGYSNKSNFYLLFIGLLGEIAMLYDSASNDSKQDTVFATALSWRPITDPTGYEEFYFINSTSPLVNLRKLINRYDNVPEKGKVKIANKIKDEINGLNPKKKEDLADIPTRLEKLLQYKDLNRANC